MSEKIAKCQVKRESGYLYFINKDGNVCKVKMAQRKAKGEPKVIEVIAKTNIKKEAGYLYFLDKDGDVSRAKMNRNGRD